MEKFGPEQEVGFPNTAYYLPIIYAMTGIGVSKIGGAPGGFSTSVRGWSLHRLKEGALTVPSACP